MKEATLLTLMSLLLLSMGCASNSVGKLKESYTNDGDNQQFLLFKEKVNRVDEMCPIDGPAVPTLVHW
jgi:hypothetical protein